VSFVTEMSSARKRPLPLVKSLQRTATRARVALLGTTPTATEWIHTSFWLLLVTVGEPRATDTRLVPR
jgi:hypothetical protein